MTVKPLGHKGYGSIPHLPDSRMGPADHAIQVGQAQILTTKTRDRHDRIIVTEKLDGSCVSVARVDGAIVAIARSGYLAGSSPYDHLKHFAFWVDQNRARFDHLQEGHRLCGEWVSMAHGTLYDLNGACPFIPFDLMRGMDRRPYDQMLDCAEKSDLVPCSEVHNSQAPLSVKDCLLALGENGRHGAIEPVEGAVWRCERRGEFEFAAKFVRPDKVDGKYLVGVSTSEVEQPIWFWHPFNKSAQLSFDVEQCNE